MIYLIILLCVLWMNFIILILLININCVLNVISKKRIIKKKTK